MLQHRFTIAILVLIFHHIDGSLVISPRKGFSVELGDDYGEGLALSVNNRGEIKQLASIGRTLTSNYDYELTKSGAIVKFAEQDIVLRISVANQIERVKISIKWNGPRLDRFEDCIKLSPYQWYGGPEQKYQYWPVQKLNFSEYSYVTKEDENNAVTERYWLNSDGTFYYVDKDAPLFIDQNSMLDDHLCFIADVKEPYSNSREHNELHYEIVLNKDAKAGHLYAVQNYLGKPKGIPDFRMIQHPIWSTWARYYRDINQSIVLNYAKEVNENSFKNSQIDVDDLWEVCYGSLTVDTKKFPTFHCMVDELKQLGFRVTLWVHPFINEGCEPWFTEAKDNGYLVKSENGSIYTSWWNNNGTKPAYIDFTNKDAADWWVKRLHDLQNKIGVDSFKFDAGESSWSPQIPVQSGNPYEHPDRITIDYVRTVAEFGPMIEVRAAQRTQDLPVFVRMLDKYTTWSFNNGLPTLITTLLQMNMNGYPLVLPDMIGGNGYEVGKPSKELFIRWLQANTFMPSMQFSFVPWQYDEETITISQKFTAIHADYAEKIKELMEKAVKDGTPVNPPIWWADPTDKEALAVWDEYLLGEDILVAPIVEEGAKSRDIYLPKGIWVYGEDNRYIYKGGSWFRDFSVPLNTLAYFIRLPDHYSVNFSDTPNK